MICLDYKVLGLGVLLDGRPLTPLAFTRFRDQSPAMGKKNKKTSKIWTYKGQFLIQKLIFFKHP